VNGIDLRIARIRSGLKQYELAQRAGLRPDEISLAENGRKRLSADKLQRCLNRPGRARWHMPSPTPASQRAAWDALWSMLLDRAARRIGAEKRQAEPQGS
jgi:hypothetical protein